MFAPATGPRSHGWYHQLFLGIKKSDGRNQRAWKNYYLVLQISQLLNDLTRFGDYIQKITGDPDATFEAVYGTMREFAEALIAHLRNRLPVFREPGCGPACQIRLAKL